MSDLKPALPRAGASGVRRCQLRRDAAKPPTVTESESRPAAHASAGPACQAVVGTCAAGDLGVRPSVSAIKHQSLRLTRAGNLKLRWPEEALALWK